MTPPTAISETPRKRPRVAVLGATLGTGNLGVDALGMSMIQGLSEVLPDLEVVYQSWDLRRRVTIPLGERVLECDPIAIRRKGSLRYRDGLSQIKRLGRIRQWMTARSLPGLPTFSNALTQLLSCNAILDVSAGDSFADIYGPEVFEYQSQIKLLCLELGLPLVLMPQTFGPFSNTESARLAGNILSRCSMVCTREAEGVQEIKQLCVPHEPQRVVRVPDMAFLLQPRRTVLPNAFQEAEARGSDCIALNISGLLYCSKRSFGLQVDYRQLSKRLLQWALDLPNSHVLLVPHVVFPEGVAGAKRSHVASTDTNDITACEHLAANLDSSTSPRVDILREANNPAAAKFAMSRCNFFVGARMHAFIGAISQGVPGSLLAYSKKADGLGNLLNISDSIVDPRKVTIDGCLNRVDALFRQRHTAQQHLIKRIPQAQAELQQFFREELAPLILGDSLVARNQAIPPSHNCAQSPQSKVST